MSGRVVTFGELLLRLKAPGQERLLQSPLLEATFGGGEANVAVSLCRLGLRASYVTALPEGPVGDAALRCLRGHGVDTAHVRRRPGRMGIYFLEGGADLRASAVLYDRAGSAAAAMAPGDFPWRDILPGADWFHVSGITPALSRSAADATLEAVSAAHGAGVRVSVDLNYRRKLWAYGVAAPEVMRPLATLADVLVGNEEDLQLALGMAVTGADPSRGKVDPEAYREMAGQALALFPQVKRVAITLRQSRSADRNAWSAILVGRDGYQISRAYELEDIVDRIGGGDAFAAGLIYGLLELGGEAEALEFATAASALKHTVPGDFNLVDRAEVQRLLGGETSGRVSR
ncbi:MAG TPA: sugar kinase [Anaeromyxobacter sp.]|nr:sugar kinase [Anaeromyxobacter sp.]